MSTDLHSAIAKLADIDAAGWLPDLERRIAYACRGGPRSEWQRYPRHAGAVECLARDSARILRASLGECRRAAAEVLMPMTYRRLATVIIDDMHRELRAAERRAG